MVLTDAGGIKDIVGPIQSNYILPADKPSYFTDLILTLFANPGTLAELSLENLKNSFAYTSKQVALQHHDLFSRLLSR